MDFGGAPATVFTWRRAELRFRGRKRGEEHDRVPIELRERKALRMDGPLRTMMALDSMLDLSCSCDLLLWREVEL